MKMKEDINHTNHMDAMTSFIGNRVCLRRHVHVNRG